MKTTQAECAIHCDVWFRYNYLTHLVCQFADNGSLEFHFSKESKHEMSFHCGLFVDEASINSPACYRYPRSRRFALLQETPIKGFYLHEEKLKQRYDLVLTHDQRLVALGAPFELCLYGTSWVAAHVAQGPKNKLLSFIGNIQHGDVHPGYALRKQVAAWAANSGVADCFGKGIRMVKDKREALDPYAFSIAMENVRQDHYFSEKLVDCFLTETVPIYWGCPGIERFFDGRGLLVFEAPAELDTITRSLSWDKYQQMLPYVRENRKRCIEQKWSDYQGQYERVAQAILAKASYLERSSPVLCRGKLAAGLRWMASRFTGRA